MMKISKYYIEIWLFPVQSIADPMSKADDKHIALMKANLLKDLYFDD